MTTSLTRPEIESLFAEIRPINPEQGKLFLCKYGAQHAIMVEGPLDFIQKTHTLFCNFGFNALLHSLGANSGFIPTTYGNLEKTLRLFFAVRLQRILGKFTPIYADNPDEEGTPDPIVVDMTLTNEAEIDEHAQALAQEFMQQLPARSYTFHSIFALNK